MENSMWRSSPGQMLVVSKVAPLGNCHFSVYHTVRGDLLILLGQCFGITIRVWWKHIYFITLSEGLIMPQWIIYHKIGFLLNELLVIVSIDMLILFCYDGGYLSTLIISIGVKSRCCWYLFLYLFQLWFLLLSLL